VGMAFRRRPSRQLANFRQKRHFIDSSLPVDSFIQLSSCWTCSGCAASTRAHWCLGMCPPLQNLRTILAPSSLGDRRRSWAARPSVSFVSGMALIAECPRCLSTYWHGVDASLRLIASTICGASPARRNAPILCSMRARTSGCCILTIEVQDRQHTPSLIGLKHLVTPRGPKDPFPLRAHNARNDRRCRTRPERWLSETQSAPS